MPFWTTPGLVPLLDERVEIINKDFARVMHLITNNPFSNKLLYWVNAQQQAGRKFADEKGPPSVQGKVKGNVSTELGRRWFLRLDCMVIDNWTKSVKQEDDDLLVL
jgi:hypothetical protein